MVLLTLCSAYQESNAIIRSGSFLNFFYKWHWIQELLDGIKPVLLEETEFEYRQKVNTNGVFAFSAYQKSDAKNSIQVLCF